eukprot:CAMPEP_0206630446 /NCGR_PEP_ID=MMETSP0325_2-20121206/67577_1 /ASSEMBLY_ACC=CAM_ASM_000347 /TAXON_ID=2866 /ORGANISM="Crypthecodinium cohnii, Strain Seligo" /LENGTH=52 /DNA_ID=CAMNT_0054155305 /DNA_START=76 /DNA_END=234 /DNA_ORIENTATION=+
MATASLHARTISPRHRRHHQQPIHERAGMEGDKSVAATKGVAHHKNGDGASK